MPPGIVLGLRPQCPQSQISSALDTLGQSQNSSAIFGTIRSETRSLPPTPEDPFPRRPEMSCIDTAAFVPDCPRTFRPVTTLSRPTIYSHSAAKALKPSSHNVPPHWCP